MSTELDARCPTCHRKFATYRADDHPTSVEAGKGRDGVHVVRKGTQRALLLRTYYLHGELCDRDAASLTGINSSGDGVRRRCSDLRQGGWIEPVGIRTGPEGTQVLFCRVSAIGANKVEELFDDLVAH